MTGREGNRQFSQVALPAKVRGEAKRSDLEGQDLYFVSKIQACLMLNADRYWPLKEG